MSDVALDREEDGELQVEVTQKSGLSGKKLVLFILLPLLLLGGGGGAAYVSGALDSLLDKAGEETEVAQPAAVPSAFYDLPELLVNLSNEGRRASYLKLSISLELPGEASIARIEAVMPRIVDNFQVYLRELRTEDLQGSAGMQRLREELLTRVNLAAHPVVVRDVLFRQMLVQ